MITMPSMPVMTASQRRRPTRSPSNGTDIAVMNSGAVKNMAVASARGMLATPMKKHMLAVMRRAAPSEMKGLTAGLQQMKPAFQTKQDQRNGDRNDGAHERDLVQRKGSTKPFDQRVLQRQGENAAEDA